MENETNEQYEEVFVDKDGNLFMKDKKRGNCFRLSPRDFIGTIEEQGEVTSIGEFKLCY